MLPKVATHLLHTTTRSAAAAVHGQTSTLRNVLQSGQTGAGASGTKPKSKSTAASATAVSTKSKAVKPVTIALVTASGSSLSSGAGSASSQQQQNTKGASSDGSNPGANSQGRSSSGSKGSNNPKAGRRFYTNYNSASRAVTQANAIIITEDVPGFQNSTSDDTPTLSASLSSSTHERRALLKASASRNSSQRRTRLRSSSVNSLLPRKEKDKDGTNVGVIERISVLKTVQAQARSLHVLSAAATKAASAPKDQPPSSATEVEVQVEVAAPPPAVDAVASIPRAPSPAAPAPLRVASPLPRPRSPIRRRNSTSSVRSTSPLSFLEEPTEVQVHLQVRRNSTVAATEHEAKDAAEAPQPPPAAAAEGPSSPSMSDVSASPSEVSETPTISTAATSVEEEESGTRVKDGIRTTIRTKYGERIHEAQVRKDSAGVVEGVRSLLNICAESEKKANADFPTHVQLTTSDFNTAINALLLVREEGQSIRMILDVYEAMLQTSERQARLFKETKTQRFLQAKPSLKTYSALIEAFTKRDWEIHRILIGLNNLRKAKDVRQFNGAFFAIGEVEDGAGEESLTAEQRKAQELKEESQSNIANALKLFEAIVEVGGRDHVDGPTYKALLRSCASHGNVKAALLVFGQWERRAGLLDVVNPASEWWGAVEKAKATSTMIENFNGPDAEAYRFLLQAFTNVGDYDGAALVFEGFKKKWEEGQVYIRGAPSRVAKMQVQVFNQMLEMYFRADKPEAAVDLLDSMLKAAAERKETPAVAKAEEQETAGEKSASIAIPPVVPAPASSTFTTIIGGFIKMGDFDTALKWFTRLLEEPSSPGLDPFAGVLDGVATKPDQVAWSLMLNALATERRVEDINKLFSILVSGLPGYNGLEDPTSKLGVRVFKSYRNTVYLANMQWLKDTSASTHEEMELVLQRLNFVRDNVLAFNPASTPFKPASPDWWGTHLYHMINGLSQMYIKFGAVGQAYHLVAPFVSGWIDCLDVPGAARSPSGTAVLLDLRNLIIGFWSHTFDALRQPDGIKELPWNVASGLAWLNMRLGLKVTPEQAAWLLHTYGQTSVHGDGLDIPAPIYSILIGCAVHVDSTPGLVAESGIEMFAFKGTASLLKDIAARGYLFDDQITDPQTRFEAVEVAVRGRDVDWGRIFFGDLGETYLQAFEQHIQHRYAALKEQIDEAAEEQEQRVESPIAPIHAYPSLQQHQYLTRTVDAALKDTSLQQEERVERAYELFHSALTSKQHVPHVHALGRLIQGCGRVGQLDKVQEVYQVSQELITRLRDNMNETKRRELWVMIEDSMVIALAHAGDIEGAHVHRGRILEYGGIKEIPPGAQPANSMIAAPSADAYGALILYVKDTTDDASNALMLWSEAMRVGVVPNIYLFNNIISKLSRARKADHALELFHTMKDQGIIPSSITYGAVIGACARVGDVASAEMLFAEMAEQSNFKPRVPPFNTMMQVYTTTKPNRERALWYYNEMKKLNVQPTAHTYKLLLDLYGSVEPLDIASMESTWEELKIDKRVQLQGTHFASLINAYGCVLKDVEKATSIFESIPSHLVNRRPLAPDAVVYEAVVNTLVANRRTDLIPYFMERMAQDKVHMTAYVANFLIKGYANVGDIAQARNIFEGMRDPPTGVAAPNNHAPHDPSVSGDAVGVMEPVYREPSTWEAMIRAELGAGHRDRAYQLLERLKVRQYPDAVFNRISGVMIDHSAVAF